MIKVEWSARRNRFNIVKHRIDFEEAKTVFSDPRQVTVNDPDYSPEERALITIGSSKNSRLIIMAHTFEDDKI